MEQFSGNYTGPYWSDGQYQESVEFGDSDPMTQLDVLSRLHDTAYAHYKDRYHREAADIIYHDQAKLLAGKFPEIAGNIVLYGNRAARQALDYVTDGPFGLAKFAGQTVYDGIKKINGTYLKTEKEDVQELFKKDPRKRVSLEAVEHKEGPGSRVLYKPQKHPVKVGVEPPQESTFITDVKKNKVVPVTGNKTGPNSNHGSPTERDLLVSNQARRLHNYQMLHAAAQKPSLGPIKYKKKHLNLKKATRILPDYMIH